MANTHKRLTIALFSCLLPGISACTPATPTPNAATPPWAQTAATHAVTPPEADATQAGSDENSQPVNDPGAGPDDNEQLFAPDIYHGTWRVVAADDRFDQGLMLMTVQSSMGQTEGSGDFVMHQPYCDLLAERPIQGAEDCELIGFSGQFDAVRASPERLVLSLHPTADGLEHRLELRREGDALVGDYVIGNGLMRRAIIARNPPGMEP